jgi:hypothetical protein|eukprot:scaffold4261_cov250-Chaetoceros_neogracile.AAC.6
MPSSSKKTSLLSTIIVAIIAVPAMSLSPVTTAIAVKDYSEVAAALFDNMRTPAALIAGSIVPLGLLAAPDLKANEPKRLDFFKKANGLLAVASLLSEILAITYSTVAINKLAEVKFAPTAGAAALITKHFELAWIGTNVHFLLGMFGFSLLVGLKAYFTYGGKVAQIAGCWSVAVFMQCTSIVNEGIAMGSGNLDYKTFRFSKNLLTLGFRYLNLALIKARGRPLSIAAFGLTIFSVLLSAKELTALVKNKVDEVE